MGKVPTLQEWSPLKFDGEMKYNKTDMIEFAKLHVEAALKAAADKAIEIQKPTSRKYVSKKELKDCYPLDKIK